MKFLVSLAFFSSSGLCLAATSGLDASSSSTHAVSSSASAAATIASTGNATGSSGALIVIAPQLLTTCQPALIKFSGGQAPYYLDIIPATNTAATPLAYLPTQSTAGTYTWNVNLAAGQKVTVVVTDSTGLQNYSAESNAIVAGPDTSCVGQAVSGASAAPDESASASSSSGASSSASGSAPSSSPSVQGASSSLSTSSSLGLLSATALLLFMA